MSDQHFWVRQPWSPNDPAVLYWWKCLRCSTWVEGIRTTAGLKFQGEAGPPSDDRLVLESRSGRELTCGELVVAEVLSE